MYIIDNIVKIYQGGGICIDLKFKRLNKMPHETYIINECTTYKRIGYLLNEIHDVQIRRRRTHNMKNASICDSAFYIL